MTKQLNRKEVTSHKKKKACLPTFAVRMEEKNDSCCDNKDLSKSVGQDDSNTGCSSNCQCNVFEEEVLAEELVHVEINGIFQDLGTGAGSDLSAISKFVGLESEQPIVQIGNQVFAGTYEDCVGTSLFFTLGTSDREEADDDDDDQEGLSGAQKVFDNRPKKKVEYLCKSDKKLVLKRVFLTPKN